MAFTVEEIKERLSSDLYQRGIKDKNIIVDKDMH